MEESGDNKLSIWNAPLRSPYRTSLGKTIVKVLACLAHGGLVVKGQAWAVERSDLTGIWGRASGVEVPGPDVRGAEGKEKGNCCTMMAEPGRMAA